ncbi:MAG: nitroreductase family protein [Roseiflexaceae bacterium]|jgi:iodotyrosine deiodinase
MKDNHVPLQTYREYPVAEMSQRARDFRIEMQRRRSIRMFADRPVARDIIENVILTAGTAPSGANQQPWHFCAVSSPEMKRKIRIAAEHEEQAFYGGRAPQEWLNALAPIGTNASKPFLDVAPWLIICFAQSWHPTVDGGKGKNYYVSESTGIAVGMLITAIHHAGLVTLTHTPSPMGFLSDICGRPENERAFLLLPVGYPADDCEVPNIGKKSLTEISTFFE